MKSKEEKQSKNAHGCISTKHGTIK
jgi:hypothetical protein